jgi:succinate dehydrogenase/fumarate reductase flavoprotein subunit
MDDIASTVDALVVGGGGSGLAAAVRGAQLGLRVLLVEKRPELGGSTGIAVGSFTASGTDHQRQQQIQDNPGDHNEDAGRFAAPDIEARGNRDLRGFFLSQAADTLRWLESFGLRFHGPSPEPPNRVPRMHNVVPNAKAYIAALQAQFLRLGGRIAVNATARQLIPEDRCVAGAVVDIDGRPRRTLARRGVVLAAGDYAGNADLIGRYKGRAFTAIEGINPHAMGDGHLLAESAGAPLVNMDVTYGPELRFVPPPRKPFTQLLPAGGLSARVMGALLPLVPGFVMNAMIKRLLVTWQHPENALFADGAILINARGERFCDESAYPEREIAVASQPGKIAYILLDEALAGMYAGWPHFISTAPEIAYAYVDDYLRLRADVAVEAPSLTDLAERRALPAGALSSTARGDGSNGRVPPLKRPLAGNRWVLLGPVKAYFTTTEGGATIDRSCRVLDGEGRPIRGLYAVGQNGLGGQILWGHGLHIAWAMTSGRLAGEALGRAEPAAP